MNFKSKYLRYDLKFIDDIYCYFVLKKILMMCYYWYKRFVLENVIIDKFVF